VQALAGSRRYAVGLDVEAFTKTAATSLANNAVALSPGLAC